ncbi:energy transducer TonB [candidate division WOR-3 bacterium]|nr:energy transducer TonB [candidate division WOR-3 bacterium]
MDKSYNLKRVFMMHIRIGFLVTLVAFIAGFIFIPEIETRPYRPEVSRVIRIDNLPAQLQNIVNPPPPVRPRMPVAAESDADVEAETIDKTNLIDEDGKVSTVEFEPPPFVYYEVPPKPLNLEKVDFSYPGIFQIEGTVFLELWIDKEGNVRNVVLVKSMHPAYDKVAIEGASKLKFSPAIQRDKPVAVRYSFPVRFEIK